MSVTRQNTSALTKVRLRLGLPGRQAFRMIVTEQLFEQIQCIRRNVLRIIGGYKTLPRLLGVAGSKGSAEWQ